MGSSVRCQFQQSVSLPSLRSYLAEFISTFIFVFAAVCYAISARMLSPDMTSEASSLVATVVAQAFALFTVVYIAADASGGHVNPAVTFGLTIAGHLSVPTAIFYWISQLMGSTLACFILHVASAGQQAVPMTGIATQMTRFGGAILEGVTTFALVYTIYVASDQRDKAARGGFVGSMVGPMAVGMVAGACVLAMGSLTGGSMNPARSFGLAIVSGDFKNQAMYWVGPLIGMTLATLVHQYLMYPSFSSASDSRLGETVVV